MWINEETKEIYSHHSQIRFSLKNISLPKLLSDELLISMGIAPIRPAPAPEHDHTKIPVESDPAKIDGEWVQQWEVVDLTPEEVEVRAQQVRAERAAGVIEERRRRLAEGFDYDFGDERGIHHIGTTPEDKRGWDEVNQWAAAMSGLGDTESTLLISTDTGPAHVTAPEWHAIVAHGAAVQQPIWQASFVLQEMDPIPEDYYDDKWWP